LFGILAVSSITGIFFQRQPGPGQEGPKERKFFTGTPYEHFIHNKEYPSINSASKMAIFDSPEFKKRSGGIAKHIPMSKKQHEDRIK
jgi:hypothetical protein